jgi:hypothetical protein
LAAAGGPQKNVLARGVTGTKARRLRSAFQRSNHFAILARLCGEPTLTVAMMRS